MLKRFIVAAAALLSLGLSAGAAEMSGQVLLPGKRPAGDAVVYLEGGLKAAPMAKATVDQRDKTFVPHVSVVTLGTTVRFPNNDSVFHNVFAYFQAKKFDLGMYPRGASKKVTFDKTGVVSIMCNVHSDMSAYIMVVDTPYFAVTDKNGRFRIPNVPPGTYTLHGWHESGATVTQTVTARPGLSLTLARR